MISWMWNGGLRCCATLVFNQRQKAPRTSSDRLLRIERCDTHNLAPCPQLAMPTSPTQPILDHIATVIRPALRKYLAAEKALTEAVLSQDARAIEVAREDVKLAARQAVDVLHHLSDFVLKEPSSTLRFAKIEDARNAVEARCVFLRTANPVADISLLRDIADAFKHHRPDRASATVLASTNVATVWVSGRCGLVKVSSMASSRSSSRRKMATCVQCHRCCRTSSMPGWRC